MAEPEAWPALFFEDWADTRRTLHMVTQMIGKVRLALAPPLPEWQHASQQVRASPDPARAVLDFLRSVYRVAVDIGGWDADHYRYLAPRPAIRPSGHE